MTVVRRVLFWSIVPAALAATALGLCAGDRTRPLLLLNRSPSMPEGVYRRVPGLAATGTVIAFRVPAPGRAYAALHLQDRLRTSILKPVVAGQGARICAEGGRLSINGRFVAPISQRDGLGQPLPRWAGCRALAFGEVFALSTRIPNSFDGRYFGPVRASAVLGVYRPLWTVTGDRPTVRRE